MGSGSTAYRIALGEAMAIQEHQLAMIPIMQKQAEMELGLKEKVFAQELEQARQMNLLTVTSEAQAMQEYQLAMIPVMQKQVEMELELREKTLAQELEQTRKIGRFAAELELEQAEKMGLLATELQPEMITQPEPVIIPAEVTDTKPAKKYLIYAALAALAYFFLR